MYVLIGLLDKAGSRVFVWPRKPSFNEGVSAPGVGVAEPPGTHPARTATAAAASRRLMWNLGLTSNLPEPSLVPLRSPELEIELLELASPLRRPTIGGNISDQ